MTGWFCQPDVAAVEAEAGRGAPLPDYVQTVLDAQAWGVSPMELEDWPMYWVAAGRIVQAAQHAAQRQRQKQAQ